MDVHIDNDKLISAVQMQTPLWDKSDPNYSDKSKKDNGWKKVFNFIFCDEEIGGWDREKNNEAEKALQKRWRHLRNSFAREVAKRKRQKTGCGRSWKTYIYYDKMAFLIPSLNHTQVDSSISGEGEVEEIEEFSESLVSAKGPPQRYASNAASNKRKRLERGENSLADVLVKHLKWRQEKAEDQDFDPDRLFILSLLNDFKRVPEENKAKVKIGLIQVISNGMKPARTHPGDRYRRQLSAKDNISSSSRRRPVLTDSSQNSVPLSSGSSDTSYTE